MNLKPLSLTAPLKWETHRFTPVLSRSLVLMVLLFAGATASAQNFSLPDGEYMDTVNNLPGGCRDRNIFYYQVNGKYPESSFDLLRDVRSFITNTRKSFTGNGYITFRFLIDCEGKMTRRVQVLQADEKYKATHFNKDFVNTLYIFLRTLDKWPVGTLKDKTAVAYRSFMSFKIKDGKIIAVIP